MSMIRKMESQDIPRAAEIQTFAWRTNYKGIYSDEYLFTEMLVINRIPYFEKMVNNIEFDVFVYDDGIVKGFLIVTACKEDDKPNAFQIWNIYADPFFQRGRVGTQLIKHFEEIARQRNFSEACLWVLDKNHGAIKFYEKSGYTHDGKTSVNDLGDVGLRYAKKL